MVAIYCRQSVDKKDSISIEQQEKYCKNRIDENIPCKTYKDKGYSGGNTNRPCFNELMKDIKNGKITKVIVYKVDRISRSLKDFVDIYSDFEKYNVEFESCSEQFDTSTAMGKATLQIIMVFAELERNMIKKRVTDNFYERGKKGLFLAGVAPYGYNKVPAVIDGINTHILEINEEQAEIVRYIYKEYAANKSLGYVVKKLNNKGYKTNRGNTFDSGAVRRILRNPVYVRADADVYMYLESKGAKINQPIDDFIGVYGCTVYSNRKSKNRSKFSTYENENVQLNQHEGIIDSDLWLSIQNELNKNKPISNSGKGTHTWLTGLTKCGYCGLGVSVVNGQRNGKRYINCGGRKKKACYERTSAITFDDIEDAVKEELINHIKEFEFTKVEHNADIQIQENELKIRLKNIQNEIDEYVLQIPKASEKVMQLINEKVESMIQQRSEIQNQLIALQKNSYENISEETVKKALTDWDNLSFEDKKLIAQTFIEKVVIYNDDIKIYYL